MNPLLDPSAAAAALPAVAPDRDPETAERPPARRRHELSGWEISELLAEPGEELIRRELERLEEAVASFEAERPALGPELEPARFLAIMRRYENLERLMKILASYAHLWFLSDTQSTAAINFRNRIHQVLTQLGNRILFFELWWQELDDAEAERLLPDAGGAGPEGQRLADFRHYLVNLRRFKPHTLDERSEQIINTKNTNGISAVLTLYSMLINRLEFHLEIDGREKTLTEDEVRSHFFSPDPDLRAACHVELFRVYERESQILAQVYANRVRDWYAENVELRSFDSPIAVRNLTNDIPDAAIETLLGVVRRNAPLFQEFFELKGRWLGFEPLRRYDLYAPLAASSQSIAWSDAVDAVLETFGEFDPRFAALAERVVRERHLDSEIRKGKRRGACCVTVLPELTPWVLVNYNGRARDVTMLAHELGHAVHSMMAEHHSLLTQHPRLPLAETASVFAEMLITDRLLASRSDPVARREILSAAVDDIYATVLRQAYFVLFELEAHRAILDNKSADDLLELYLQNLRQQFGDAVDVTPEFRYEWLSIPHLFSTPFYCYAYSFGQLLVLALYRRYQEQGDAFKPGYFRLLAHGGSARPAEILGEIDIDIADPDFWQGGFDVVRGMIEELRSTEAP